MTVTVEVALENALLDIIRKKLIFGLDGTVGIIGEKYVQLMKCAMDNDFISSEKLEEALHKRLCQLGRKEYEWCIKTSCYPDHVESHEALGYAILHDLSDEEITNLHFDHGETKYDYTDIAHHLLQNVVTKLRHGSVV